MSYETVQVSSQSLILFLILPHFKEWCIVNAPSQRISYILKNGV